MRICRRCLLAETDREAYQQVAELIGLIPAEERTDGTLYQQRLALCKACDMMHNGLCALCGCYVEHRAAKRNICCPHEKQYW